MLDESEVEADTALTRRIQAEELGLLWSRSIAVSVPPVNSPRPSPPPDPPNPPNPPPPNAYREISRSFSDVENGHHVPLMDGRTLQRQILVENANAAVSTVFTSGRFISLCVFCGLIEISCGVYVLAKDWGNTCDVPLHFWISVFLLRYLVAFPVDAARFLAGRAHHEPLMEQVQRIDNVRTFCTYLWLIFGVILLSLASSCYESAPDVYKFTLAVLVLHMSLVCSPVIIIVGVCLCLPCVLLVFRFFQPRQGMTSSELVGLEQRVFGDRPTDVVAEDVGESADTRPACVICQTNFSRGDELRVLTCSHEFHIDCVDRWLAVKATCPLCRRNLIEHSNEEVVVGT